jgi:hypothetical protein
LSRPQILDGWPKAAEIHSNREEKNPHQNIELTLNLSGHDNLHRHPIVLAEPQVNEMVASEHTTRLSLERVLSNSHQVQGE